MNILVTGGSGFVGRHMVNELLERGHKLTLLGRDKSRVNGFPWCEQVEFITWDIHSQVVPELNRLGNPDALVHLAWQGLPNYKELFHVEENLPADYHFIESLAKQGLKNIMVTGTCLEYGLQEGELQESMQTAPTLPYAIAKDRLRKKLQKLQKNVPFRLLWCRLYYLYGKGQNPNSLLALLDRTIEAKKECFDMSGGEQIRDYLPVEAAVEKMAGLLESTACKGIYNICSGRPISVKSLVEKHLEKRGGKLRLNLGYYPYPDYEPMAFWGDVSKLESCLLGSSQSCEGARNESRDKTSN